MNTQELASQMLHTSMMVVCEHGAWSEAMAADGSWRCAAGEEHDVIDSVVAHSAWESTFSAWRLLDASRQPSSLAEFHRCFDALTAQDLEIRTQIRALQQGCAHRRSV